MRLHKFSEGSSNLRLSQKHWPDAEMNMNENCSTVLVIDDNHDLAEMLACYLAHVGIRPVIATSGITGLHQAQALLPALILCDSCMPGMDGLQLIAAMRLDPVTAHIPIVLMSGNDVGAYDGAAASALLQKPFNMSEMLTLVRSLIMPSSGVPVPENNREALAGLVC